MNVSDLENVCKKALEGALDQFKRTIDLELWEIDKEAVDEALESMYQEIGTNVMKRFYEDGLSDPQKRYLYNKITEIKKTARKLAVEFVWEWWRKK